MAKTLQEQFKDWLDREQDLARRTDVTAAEVQSWKDDAVRMLQMAMLIYNSGPPTPSEGNPNSELTRALRDQWQKIAGLMVWKFGPADGRGKARREARITQDDIRAFGEMFPGDIPAVTFEVEGVGGEEVLLFRIIPMSQAKRLAEADERKRKGG